VSIEAMKQALEALEYFDGEYDVKDEITALRAAIAEASMQRLTDVQQEMEATSKDNLPVEPVAWIDEHGNIDRGWDAALQPNGWQPLYTHPPRREWVGLTDEGMRQAAQAMDAEPLADGWKELVKFARAIDAKLKETNT